MHLPWRDVAPAPGCPAIPTSILEEEADQLRKLAAGRRVFEVGAAYGFSACVMALAGAELVVSADPHTWLSSAGIMRDNLGRCGVIPGQVEQLIQESAIALPDYAANGEKFGLVFVDGDHSAPAVEFDVTWALEVLEPGGTLACHDLGEDCCCPGVRAALGKVFPGGPDELTGTLAVYHAPHERG